ncbi:MAG: nucleotidyltransferase domain-containing protein [Nanoarchaeota archaeon]|nr:nucleotidyltransferase domain-containing protein [Nanoarchaeota archaeon]
MESKEEQVLEPFFNSPKHWHFDELLKKADISRSQLTQWLKKFKEEGIIKRVKSKGKMPYYVHNFDNPDFQYKKRLFGLKKLTNSGLFNHLFALKGAKVVILFGSFSRSDWYGNSDIDIFIYGNDDEFEQGKYELKLDREIQVHNAKNKKDLKRISKMLPYIISGSFIKGSIQDLGVEVNAKV